MRFSMSSSSLRVAIKLSCPLTALVEAAWDSSGRLGDCTRVPVSLGMTFDGVEDMQGATLDTVDSGVRDALF